MLNKYQSHIGAIRMLRFVNRRLGRNAFQSHIGAIRIRCGRTKKMSSKHFNPTLVQLESKFRRVMKIFSMLFQSHIGAIRIKPEQSKQIQRAFDFNPTLVQLEYLRYSI